MQTNSKDRLESLLEEWSTEGRWKSAFAAQNAVAGDPLPCDVCCPLEDQENPEIIEALARWKRVIHFQLDGSKYPNRVARQLIARKHLLAQYAEIRELINREAPFLLDKFPMIEKRCTTRTDACLVKHAWQVKAILKHLRNNKVMERRKYVTAEDLAAYFGTPIGAMRMRLKRIRDRNWDSFLDLPAKGDQRTRTDGYQYRTKKILTELRNIKPRQSASKRD